MMLGAVLLAGLITLTVFLVALTPPQIDLPSGAEPVRVGDISLTKTDLYPEPDHLGTYPAMEAFFARQSQISALLQRETVEVTYVTQDGIKTTQMVAPRDRCVSDLSYAFWFQQGVGILALLMGGAVAAAG